jgi:hypothetical protein
MASPFPGMNPNLEQSDCWQDFHQSYMKEIRDQIVALAGLNYVVKLEAHIYIRELPNDPLRFVGKADVGLSHPQGERTAVAGTSVLEAPVLFRVPAVEMEKSAYIEIRDKAQRQLVTVIEMLSPTNKYSGADREAYLTKRLALLHSPVNFVELDFYDAAGYGNYIYLGTPEPALSPQAETWAKQLIPPRQSLAPST